MKAGAPTARIAFGADEPPHSLDYGDRYHARGGAFEQAREVFLAGNGLPRRWARRPRFVILETGFGLGNNFLATWAQWRDDPARCQHLYFLSVDQHPPALADLRRAHAASLEPALAAALIAQWPAATCDLHTRHFAEGRVHLLLAFGDVQVWLPQWVAEVDAFFLDGFAPARNAAMWQPRVFAQLSRIAAPGATAATWSSARVVREGLAGAGFTLQRCAGFDGKRERIEATHMPRHRAARPAGRRFVAIGAGTVAVVGAGLAGASVARAVASLGLACTVFDAAGGVARGASGQYAALLHGVVHGDDTPHARWYRIAALHAACSIAPAIAQGRVSGRLDGLLRLERRLDVASMQALLQRCALPAEVVAALSRDAAASRAGCALGAAAWWYPSGGWIDPRSLVHAALDSAAIELRTGSAVAELRRDDNGRWLLLDRAGCALGRFDAVVLANADGAATLAQSARGPGRAALRWPLSRSRGQVSLLPASLAGDWLPAHPVAGAGYAIVLPDRRLLCGATLSLDDDEPMQRARDHQYNLDALRALSGKPWPIDVGALAGRVAWRTHSRDRLPLVGGVPADDAAGPRGDQPRFIAREPGLFVAAALGSRGLAQAPLAGEIVAAMIAGAPLPIGAPLLDAIDPARFAARARRGASAGINRSAS